MSKLNEGQPQLENDFSARIEEAENHLAWEESVRLRKEKIALERQGKNNFLLWKPLSELADQLLIMGLSQEAMSLAEEALANAEQADMDAAVAFAARAAAHCALVLDKPDQALAYIQQGVMAIQSERTRKLSYGRTIEASTLLERARCYVAQSNLAAAEQDLADVWTVLKPYQDSEIMTGLRWRITDWWEIKGRLHHHKGENQEAIECFQRSLAAKVHCIASDINRKPVALYRYACTLHFYEEALEAAGQIDEAHNTCKEIQEICELVHLPFPDNPW
jgi:tetratricopeptide (TPR) repeat protein